MSATEFLLMLLVAAILGGIGESLGGYSAGGCLMSIVVGFVGAFVGRIIRDVLGLPTFWTVRVGDTNFPIIWSIIGAAVTVSVLRLVLNRRRVS